MLHFLARSSVNHLRGLSQLIRRAVSYVHTNGRAYNSAVKVTDRMERQTANHSMKKGTKNQRKIVSSFYPPLLPTNLTVYIFQHISFPLSQFQDKS